MNERMVTAQGLIKICGRSARKPLKPDGATLPITFWLERYPNEQLAKWSVRLARLQAIWNRKGGHQ